MLKAGAGRYCNTYTIARDVAISDFHRYKITRAVATGYVKGYKATKAVAISDSNSCEVICAVATASDSNRCNATNAVATASDYSSQLQRAIVIVIKLQTL